MDCSNQLISAVHSGIGDSLFLMQSLSVSEQSGTCISVVLAIISVPS